MLVDTDVLIWYSRANPKAINFIHQLDGFSISVVTYMEIMQGTRNQHEAVAFNRLVSQLSIKIIQIDELISSKAMFFVEKYALSHNMQLADALIGVTAINRQLKLATANTKHYQYLQEVKIEKFEV